MVAVMSMASVNMMAQGRGGAGGPMGGHDGQGREMVGRGGGMGGHDMRGGHDRGGMHGGYDRGGMRGGHDRMYGHMDNGIRHGHERYVDRHGWYPGYVGRVRYIDGRWGYWRDNAWYYYDCFYDPAYYYARPLHHFRPHLFPRAGRVAAGVIGGAVVGAVISSLVR